MRAFIFCFLMAICLINNVHGQRDSLIMELEKTLQAQIDSLGEEHLDVAVLCDSLGWIYMDIGDYVQADSLFIKALEIKIKKFQEKNSHIADSYNNLGVLHYYMSDYDKAISFHNKALNIWPEILGEQDSNIATTYNNLGNIYYTTGHYEEAISFHNRALSIWLRVSGGKHPNLANSYNNLGNIYSILGDNEEAIKLYGKALNIDLEVFGEKHPYIAHSYNNLGDVYMKIGDYEKAISCLNKALNIYLKALGEKHHYAANSYNILGYVYGGIGNYEKAISCLEKALNIRLNVFDEKHPTLADSYIALGLTYNETGDYEKAISYLNKSLDILIDVFDEKHSFVAISYNNLGLTYYETGDYEKAISYFNKASDIFIDVFDEKHNSLATSYGNIGLAYNGMGNYEKAINYYNKALDIWLGIFDKKHSSVMLCYENVSITYEESHNYKIADSLWHITIPQNIEHLQKTYLFLSEKQRIKYLKTLNKTYNNFYSFTTNHGTDNTKELAANLLLNTKALDLDYSLNTRKLIKQINDDSLSNTSRELTIINNQLAKAETMSEEELKKIGWDITEKREKQEKLAFQMLQHPELRKKLNPETIEWQDIQNHLEVDEATIDFMDIYDRKDSTWVYYAIITTKNTVNPEFIRIVDDNTLDTYLASRKNFPRYLTETFDNSNFYEQLWRPLIPHLKGIKTIHLSPAGRLHNVAFEALLNEDKQYLSDKYEFRYYSAMRDLLKEKQKAVKYESAVLIGNIDYDLSYNTPKEEILEEKEGRSIRSGFDSLPGTREEIYNLDSICRELDIKTIILEGQYPTEDTISYFIRDKAPSIYHFATHGGFLSPPDALDLHIEGISGRLRTSDNPLQRSLLVLHGGNYRWAKNEPAIRSNGEDGILTALEVTGLDLQNTNLVVLSACETAKGKVYNTEGVFGLQRAFKLAGVDNVIASLWNVDDETTKELMIRFYTNLLEKKMEVATALREAKKSMREDDYQPKDWAGFILIE